MNLKTLLPVAENNRPLRNEPRDLIRTRQLKEKEKKMKLNGGPANGTSGHGARGLYLTPRKRITLLGDPAISTRAGLYQAFLLTATANANANLSEQKDLTDQEAITYSLFFLHLRNIRGQESSNA